MKTFVIPMLAVSLFAGSVTRCAAKDDVAVEAKANKPVAVLSIASYERLMTDLAFIGDLMGSPDLDKNIEGAIQLFTQGQGLNGLDKKRPLGVTLTTDGTQFQPLLVLPVTNLKQLLEALAGLIGEAQDAGDGVFELNVFDQKVFVKEHNGCAFISQSPESLAHLPKDPAKLFFGLDKSYDIAGRLYIQNVPELYRTLLIDQLRLGVQNGVSRQDGESDEAFAARKKTVDGQIDLLTKAVNELDELTLGVALDPKNKSAHLDLSFSAVAGSDSAKLMARMQDSTSEFSGFLLPDAAAALNLALKVDKASSGQVTAALDGLRASAMQQIDAEGRLKDDASKKLAKEMVSEVFDAIGATLQSGKIDVGAALKLGNKTIAVAAGAYVAEPKKLEDALKKFAKLMEQEPKFPGIKFDAEQYAGIHFHTTSIPVPQDEAISKVLGDKLDVAVGIGPKSVYLALGNDGMKLCKMAIDKSKAEASKKVPPVQLNVALTPIFQFAAAMQDQPNITAMAEVLAKSQGKDKVRVTVKADGTNVTTIRLEAEQGVLQLLGTALQQSGGLPGIGP